MAFRSFEFAGMYDIELGRVWGGVWEIQGGYDRRFWGLRHFRFWDVRFPDFLWVLGQNRGYCGSLGLREEGGFRYF